MEDEKFIQGLKAKYTEFKADIEKAREQGFFNDVWLDYLEDVYITKVSEGLKALDIDPAVVFGA